MIEYQFCGWLCVLLYLEIRICILTKSIVESNSSRDYGRARIDCIFTDEWGGGTSVPGAHQGDHRPAGAGQQVSKKERFWF